MASPLFDFLNWIVRIIFSIWEHGLGNTQNTLGGPEMVEEVHNDQGAIHQTRRNNTEVNRENVNPRLTKPADHAGNAQTINITSSHGICVIGNNTNFYNYPTRGGEKERYKSEKVENLHQTKGKILQKSSTTYQIQDGYCLVIHNKYFEKSRQRDGSENDLIAIKNFCREANLVIDVKENVRVREIRSHCRYLTGNKKIFRKHDGFVCFILSHGDSYGIRGSSDDLITTQEIISYFKGCNELREKPKVFFIQACRNEVPVEDDNPKIETKERLCPPESSDILIAHSTIQGEKSFRNVSTGSWFIQTLMKHFKSHAHNSHLMDIMTCVNEDIAGSDLGGYRQMPIQVSTLTKFVYFKMAKRRADVK